MEQRDESVLLIFFYKDHLYSYQIGVKKMRFFQGRTGQGRYPEESARFPDEQASNSSGVCNIMQNTMVVKWGGGGLKNECCAGAEGKWKKGKLKGENCIKTE